MVKIGRRRSRCPPDVESSSSTHELPPLRSWGSVIPSSIDHAGPPWCAPCSAHPDGVDHGRDPLAAPRSRYSLRYRANSTLTPQCGEPSFGGIPGQAIDHSIHPSQRCLTHGSPSTGEQRGRSMTTSERASRRTVQLGEADDSDIAYKSYSKHLSRRALLEAPARSS